MPVRCFALELSRQFPSPCLTSRLEIGLAKRLSKKCPFQRFDSIVLSSCTIVYSVEIESFSFSVLVDNDIRITCTTRDEIMYSRLIFFFFLLDIYIYICVCTREKVHPNRAWKMEKINTGY